MWSKVISLRRDRDKDFGYLLNEVENIKELSSAVGESGDFKYIYLAGLSEKTECFVPKIEQALATVLVENRKRDFYKKSIKMECSSCAAAALFSSLVYLDIDGEKIELWDTLNDMDSYSIEGIYRFRMRGMRDNWGEVADLCNRFLADGADESSIYNIIAYINAAASGKGNALFLYEDKGLKLRNLSSRRNVEIKCVYDRRDFDLINTVIAAKCARLFVDNVQLDKQLLRALRHITSIKNA